MDMLGTVNLKITSLQVKFFGEMLQMVFIGRYKIMYKLTGRSPRIYYFTPFSQLFECGQQEADPQISGNYQTNNLYRLLVFDKKNCSTSFRIGQDTRNDLICLIKVGVFGCGVPVIIEPPSYFTGEEGRGNFTFVCALK